MDFPDDAMLVREFGLGLLAELGLEASLEPSGLFESFGTLFGGRRSAGPGWPSI